MKVMGFMDKAESEMKVMGFIDEAESEMKVLGFIDEAESKMKVLGFIDEAESGMKVLGFIMGLNISLFSGYPLLPFPLLLTPLPPKKTQIAERSTVRVLILIDYDIASGPLSTNALVVP